MDNDDAIHKDFTNCIQQAFIPDHNTIIDVIKGYQLVVNTDNYDVRQYTSLYNPFISLVEDATKFETIMAKNHEHWKTLPNRIVYNQNALWLQVIHGDNILNSKINFLKKVYQLDLNMFGLKDIHQDSNMLKTTTFNLATMPLRLLETFKIKVKRIINKK